MPEKVKLNKLLIICMSTAIIFVVAACFALFFIKGKISDVEFVKKVFHDKFSLAVSCETIKTKLSWFSYDISSPYFSLGEDNSSKHFLELKNVHLKLNFSAILFKKVSINKIEADELNINATRLSNNEIDILKHIKFGEKSPVSLDLSSVKVNIPKYNLTFNDLVAKSKFQIDGNAILADGLDINKKFMLKTDGKMVFSSSSITSPYYIDVDFSKKRGKMHLKKHEIVLSSINTSFLKNYFQKLGLFSSDALIDIYSTALKDGTYKLYLYINNLNVAFNYNGEKNTIVSNKPLINEIDFSFIGKDLNIKNGKFLGDNIDIAYSGVVKNIFAFKNIEPKLEIKVSDTSIKNLVKILPDTIIPFQEPYIKYIKLYNLNGLVNGYGKLEFKNMDDFNVDGKLDFFDLYIVERPKNAKTSFAECEFKGTNVEMKIYANAPNDAVLTIFGKTKMQKLPPGEFEVKSHGKLDLNFALNILKPVQKTLALKLGPLPFMSLKGDGEIELSTVGTKEKADLKGWFKTDNATVSMEGLNAVLNNGKVKVLFEGQNIKFNGAKGYINGALTSIDGSANTNGDINVDVDVKNILATNAIKIAKTSKIVTDALDGGEFLNSFKPKSGKVDFSMNLSGNIPPDAVFGEQSDSVLAKGKIIFKGIDLIVEPKIKASNLVGTLDFDNNAKFNLKANIFDSPFKITGSIYQKGAKNKVVHNVPSTLTMRFISDEVSSSTIGNFINDNIILFAPQNRLFAKNLAQIFLTNKFIAKGDVKASGLVYSNASELDLSGFDFQGTVSGVNKAGSDFLFKDGAIILKGKNAKFDKLRIIASGVDFSMNGAIDKFASIKPFNNLKITLYESSSSSYLNLLKKILPKKCIAAFDGFEKYTGVVSGKIKLYSDKIDGEIVPKNLSVYDKKGKMNIVLKSGKIKLKNDKTYINALNFLYGELPVYIDGFVQTDGEVNPEFNIFLTTNLSEAACDKLINPYLKYPLLITGEAMIKARLQGRLNSYVSYLTLVLNEGSDMSFMGFKFKDIDSKREINSKIRFNGNFADIDHINYCKYVLSQNNKQSVYDLVKVSGGILLKKGDVILRNLKLETPNPAPVSFLNLFFRKSLVKDGLFTSNLVLNGSPADIKATGNLTFSQVFVPMYNSVVDKIKIDLNEKTGKATFKLSVFDTVGDFTIDFQNKVTLPAIIDNMTVYSSSVSIDNLMKAFTTFADTASKTGATAQNMLSPSDVLIKKGNLTVDEIFFNGVTAKNLKLNFSHSKSDLLTIDDAYLGIAGGLFKGSGTYNFDTKDVEVSSDFIDCDANELTKAFFNLTGQIYGNANGEVTFQMKDFTPDDYISKIKVDAKFEILNGKLPKLGSIEYLLRASNFFKSGIFGLTLNNIIDLLTPYKHGDFNKISGTFKINDSSIQELKIYSQGENLSTYTYGSYNIPSGMAEIEVLGKLSRKVSNLLGPIGNASVVSVLNVVTRNKMNELVKTEVMKNVGKIPLMNLNNDDFRLFNVKLKGEVTTDDIVKSFTWLN